jgi:hypothetical protein
MGHLKEARPADFVTGFQSLFVGSAPDSAAAGALAAAVTAAAAGWGQHSRHAWCVIGMKDTHWQLTCAQLQLHPC